MASKVRKQETVRAEKAKIGNVYHPYDLKSGKKQDAQCVARLLLEGIFDEIDTATRR
jgi:hypothetical protein